MNNLQDSIDKVDNQIAIAIKKFYAMLFKIKDKKDINKLLGQLIEDLRNI